MKKILLFLCAFSILFILSCAALSAKEIGRVPFSSASTSQNPEWKSITLDLKKDEMLWFWTDMDVEYDEDLVIEYAVQTIRGKDTLGYIKLEPFKKNVTLNEEKTTLIGHTNWHFNGQMDALKVKETGTYIFRVVLIAEPNTSIKLKRGDLVLKK